MKRINIGNLTIPKSLYTEPLTFRKDSNGWPSELTFLLSYDFPELKDYKIDKCIIYETGLIIFYNNGNPSSAYKLFEAGTEEKFSEIFPNFSYMRDLKNWKNNPLHYHVIPIVVSDTINSSISTKGTDKMAVFKKKYKFKHNNKYYFTADFDGYDQRTAFSDDPSIKFFESDDNGFYTDTTDESNNDIFFFMFSDISSAVRIRCSEKIEKIYISDKYGNYILPEKSNVYCAIDSNGELISNDFIIPAINNSNIHLKFFNGILLAIKLSKDTKVGSTGVLEVWT